MGGLQREGGGEESGPPPPPKKSPKIGFLSILIQRNANLTVFRWQANDGPLLWCLDPLSHHQLKKNVVKEEPPPLPRKKFLAG